MNHYRTLLITTAISFVLYSCGNSSAATQAATSDTAKTKAETPKVENWIYSEEDDKMDNSKFEFAEATSTNKLEFKFPYEGGSEGNILVRYKKVNEVILVISKGQFVGHSVRIKFDNGKPQTFGYSEPVDGRSNTIFLNSSPSILKQLKTARHVIIESEYFQEGRQILEFNVDGLAWKH